MQGWEEEANHPSEAVHESYEVVFAPMVFVRKVGMQHVLFQKAQEKHSLRSLFSLCLVSQSSLGIAHFGSFWCVQGPSTATELVGAPWL